MGKGSVAVLKNKIDVQKVIDELNVALAEEWLAFYQYWIGAQVIEGFQRPEVEKEFMEHAKEEFGHAQLLAARIKELDGVPVLSPQQWFDIARCKYEKPTNFDVEALLQDNIAAERCAINRYQEIAAMTDGIDFVTCDMAKHILAEEEEHEQDLVDYLIDLERAIGTFKKHMDAK
ncbi:MAG: ferritin-like domain-containing protein [Bacteroidales bacterium]